MPETRIEFFLRFRRGAGTIRMLPLQSHLYRSRGSAQMHHHCSDRPKNSFYSRSFYSVPQIRRQSCCLQGTAEYRPPDSKNVRCSRLLDHFLLIHIEKRFLRLPPDQQTSPAPGHPVQPSRAEQKQIQVSSQYTQPQEKQPGKYQKPTPTHIFNPTKLNELTRAAGKVILTKKRGGNFFPPRLSVIQQADN